MICTIQDTLNGVEMYFNFVLNEELYKKIKPLHAAFMKAKAKAEAAYLKDKFGVDITIGNCEFTVGKVTVKVTKAQHGNSYTWTSINGLPQKEHLPAIMSVMVSFFDITKTDDRYDLSHELLKTIVRSQNADMDKDYFRHLLVVSDMMPAPKNTTKGTFRDWALGTLAMESGGLNWHKPDWDYAEFQNGKEKYKPVELVWDAEKQKFSKKPWSYTSTTSTPYTQNEAIHQVHSTKQLVLLKDPKDDIDALAKRVADEINEAYEERNRIPYVHL